MTATAGEPSALQDRSGAFCTTHWSVVLAAGADSSPGAQAALDQLCRTYWFPLYAYVRRHGQSEHDAQDTTQEFFARFLERDSDRDRMNNWQEWIAGTVPTDASSALRLLAPTTGVSGTIVSWESVTNRTYFLERATNFGSAPPISALTSNIAGQAGTTSYADTNAVGPGPSFYRVGVQQ